MVSRCCSMEVFFVSGEFSYYSCAKCCRACELKEIKNVFSAMATDNKNVPGLYRAHDGARWLARLSNKWSALATKYGKLVRPRPRTYMGDRCFSR